jgi:hypothetical protein
VVEMDVAETFIKADRFFQERTEDAMSVLESFTKEY